MMRKIFLLGFTVALVFLFSFGALAKTITVDFDDGHVTAGQYLSDQYQTEGIYFQSGLDSSSATSAVITNDIVADNATTKLMVSDSNPIYILLNSPLIEFTFDKWEPASGSYGTVYWNFYYKNNGIWTQVYNVDFSNSDEDGWITLPEVWDIVTFTADQQILAIKIWSDNTPCYLDNLIFEVDGTSTAVSEPATFFLISVGLMGLSGIRRKFQNIR